LVKIAQFWSVCWADYEYKFLELLKTSYLQTVTGDAPANNLYQPQWVTKVAVASAKSPEIEFKVIIHLKTLPREKPPRLFRGVDNMGLRAPDYVFMHTLICLVENTKYS